MLGTEPLDGDKPTKLLDYFVPIAGYREMERSLRRRDCNASTQLTKSSTILNRIPGFRAIDPVAAIKAGIACVPADRRSFGGFGQFSAMENITLPQLSDLRRPWGAINRKKEVREVRDWMDRLQVKPQARIEQAFDLVSGGNQQKIVLAKWLRTKPKVLLVDEPTQGVDVGAQAEIYSLITGAVAQGAAVIVSSSDVSELVAICHRVLVLHSGEVAFSFSGDTLSEARLVSAVLADGSSGP